MKTAYIGMIIALMIIFVTPSQSIMRFSYTCDGTDATATTYSYLREPRISEQGYSIGLKSGSFNYLKNGNITIQEDIDYYYGNGTNISNSTESHTLEVDFEGEKGISEFFARGFFDNNRWISAWKKIRYDVSPTMKIDGWDMISLPSNSINVRATAKMDSSINASSYVLEYDAKIKNGVISTKDAAGWTNRSGSRKYDWEHDSLSSGRNVNISNYLYDYEDITTAIGPGGDWLPCCFRGTIPAIDQLDAIWPSDVMITTLNANRLLPTRNLSAAYSMPSGDSPTYWKREIQVGLSSRPSVPVQNAELSTMGLSKVPWSKQGGVGLLKANQLLPTMHLSTAYSPPSSSSPVYWKREAQIGLRSLLPSAIVPLPMTVNSSPSMPLQERANSSLFASVPVQNPANCIGDNCPANFFVSKNQTDLSCQEGACDGYDCIYTYDEDSLGASVKSNAVALRKGEERKITVSLFGFELNNSTSHPFGTTGSEKAKEEKYNITIFNDGDVTLKDVQVTADLAKGIKFIGSIYSGYRRGVAEPSVIDPQPFPFDETKRTIVKWDIGDLHPLEERSILFQAFIKSDLEGVKNTDIKVKVNDSAVGNIQVKDSVNEAEIVTGGCGWVDTVNGDECTPTESTKDRCVPARCWIDEPI